MPRFSRISWKSRDEAEPPRIASSSEAAKRRRSERDDAGRADADVVLLGVLALEAQARAPARVTSGVRTRRASAPAARRAGGRPARAARAAGRARGCPAAARTMLPGDVRRAGGRREIDRRRDRRDHLGACRSPAGRAGAREKTASESRSWTRSCGASSTIAISSSTTSRSESRSAKRRREDHVRHHVERVLEVRGPGRARRRPCARARWRRSARRPSRRRSPRSAARRRRACP